MAILSAHSRRSPTTIAESSPTLEEQFDSTEMQYSDEIKSIHVAVDKDMEYSETSIEEYSAETESQANLHSTCATEAGAMAMQEISTKEENSSNDLSKQINIEKEMPSLDIELIPKAEDVPQNVTAHLEILSKGNKESDKEVIDKSSEIEQCMMLKSQTLPKVFRGDSRDSGIGDCISSLMNSSLQIDELGMVSTIEEEMDHEAHKRESERTFVTEENRRSPTVGILANLVQDKKALPSNTEITANDGKVATKSDVTKASCETNPVRKGVCKCRIKFSCISNIYNYLWRKMR